MTLNWGNEAQHAVHGLIGDVLASPDPAGDWDHILNRRLGPILVVNPDIGMVHAVLVEAVGVALVAVHVAAAMTGRPPAEVLEVAQRWRLPKPEEGAA